MVLGDCFDYGYLLNEGGECRCHASPAQNCQSSPFAGKGTLAGLL